MKRTCLDCVHMDAISSTPGYSEFTPGTDWHMLCRLYKWALYGDEATRPAIVKALKTAATCDAYKEREVTADDAE